MKPFLFETALHKLRWSWLGGEWSAQIRPNECLAVLERIDEQQAQIAYLKRRVEQLESGKALGGDTRADECGGEESLAPDHSDAPWGLRRAHSGAGEDGWGVPV